VQDQIKHTWRESETQTSIALDFAAHWVRWRYTEYREAADNWSAAGPSRDCASTHYTAATTTTTSSTATPAQGAGGTRDLNHRREPEFFYCVPAWDAMAERVGRSVWYRHELFVG